MNDIKVLLLPEEQIVLRDLIRTLQPTCILEIGVAYGGSAFIMASEMPSHSRIVGVDSDPRTAYADIPNGTLVKGQSPAVLATLSDRFDFVFIDGDHSYAGALADIEGVLPLLMPEAHLLFHDAFYNPVKQAIDAALVKYPALKDCGYVSDTKGAPADDGYWGGLYLLHYKEK